MREVRLLLGQMVAESRRTKCKRDQSMSQSPDELEPSQAKRIARSPLKLNRAKMTATVS